MRDYFKKISELLFNNLKSSEILILNIDAEKTDFIRFNHAKIRQAGNVNQITLSLSMILKNKTLTSIIRLSSDFKKDSLLLRRTLSYLRREIPELPNDPYLIYEKNINSFQGNDIVRSLNNYEITENMLPPRNH